MDLYDSGSGGAWTARCRQCEREYESGDVNDRRERCDCGGWLWWGWAPAGAAPSVVSRFTDVDVKQADTLGPTHPQFCKGCEWLSTDAAHIETGWWWICTADESSDDGEIVDINDCKECLHPDKRSIVRPSFIPQMPAWAKRRNDAPWMRCPNCGNACINEATSDGKTKCSNCGHWYTGDESRLAGKKVAEALGHTEAWRQNEISKPDPAAQPKEPLFGGVIGRITTEDVKRVMKEMFNEQRPFWKARCGVAQSAERPAPTAQTDTSPPAIEYVVIALEQRVTALEQRLAELREAVENGA